MRITVTMTRTEVIDRLRAKRDEIVAEVEAERKKLKPEYEKYVDEHNTRFKAYLDAAREFGKRPKQESLEKMLNAQRQIEPTVEPQSFDDWSKYKLRYASRRRSWGVNQVDLFDQAISLLEMATDEKLRISSTSDIARLLEL